MSLRTNQMEDFLVEIRTALDETRAACESMAHVDVEAVARGEAKKELHAQAEAVAALTASIKDARKTANGLRNTLESSVFMFRAFVAALVVATLAFVFVAWQVHELKVQTYVTQDRIEQAIWNQTNPQHLRGLWDIQQYHNDRDYQALQQANQKQQ